MWPWRTRNHPWWCGYLPSSAVRCWRSSGGASAVRPTRRIWHRRCTCGCCESASKRRQASGIDIDEVATHEWLETLPEFDGEVDLEQRVARLRVVLKQLRPKWQAAVELYFTHGLSYREIATRLEVSPQMVKKYVAQALLHCRRRMARLG